MPKAKNHNSPIPTDDVGVATAGVNERAGTSAGALLNLARPSLPASGKKHHGGLASAQEVAYQEQYTRAIAMSSAELGFAIKQPTKRIAKHLGQAIAHEEKAKIARDQAKAEFCQNIGYYYEAKQRLLNPGYRTDVDGGKNRTPDENQKNFGARDWATFNANCKAYSLQHADYLLKQFAKSNDLLTDDGENIDDPESEDDQSARPSRRSTNDITAQKRYEHIATAAMSIASSNPEGEVEKQILAAAEYVPTPLTSLHPDLYTEVLSFVTTIVAVAPNENVKADAKKLRAKLLLFRPAPEPTKLLAEATAEEKRKRDRRLAKKNSKPLGSAVENQTSSRTSEDLQRFQLNPCAGAEVIQTDGNSSTEPGTEPPAMAPANEVAGAGTRPTRAAAPVGPKGLEVTQENLVLPDDACDLQTGNVAEDNLPGSSAGPSAPKVLPNGVQRSTQLMPGKKYQVRPAPRGGYGIYESRSTVLLHWYAGEDDARDAIDSVIAIEVCA